MGSDINHVLTQGWGTCGLLSHKVRPSLASGEKEKNYLCNYVTNNCKIFSKISSVAFLGNGHCQCVIYHQKGSPPVF